jgi:hypothetical protein
MPSQSAQPEDDAPSHTGDRSRFRHFFRCKACGGRFHVDRLTADSAKVKTPNCPRKSCGGKAKQSHMPDIGMDVAAGRAPSTPSVQATAYDMAMKIAMEDGQVTNIQDHSRPGAPVRNGENTAPKLPAHLQPLADGFWGGKRNQGKTRTARADLSPIYGERATAAQGGAPVLGQRFTADNAPGVAPILTSKPTGSSPIPDHVSLGNFNPGRR